MGLARFLIRTHPVKGLTRVEVNGDDITDDVMGVAIVSRIGEPTVVDVRLAGNIDDIEGEGIVKLYPDVDQRQAVADWLAALDPGELDRQVLDRLGYGGGTPVTETLTLLLEMVRGET